MKRSKNAYVLQNPFSAGFLFFLCLIFFACIIDDDDENEIKCHSELTKKKKITGDDEDAVNYDEFDEYFKYQGYLNYSGKYGLDEYEAQAAIDIIPAWKITKGAGVKVMVFDNGIQSSHEELERISIWNVNNQSNSCEPPEKKNESSHGTAISGLIAARENGKGIMGVAPECEYLFIGDPTEYFSDADIIKAFEYAKNQGVKVISCSWGSYNASSTFESCVKNLYDNGITLVFAAGNENLNLDNKPDKYGNGKDESEIRWVIGVSASDTKGIKADFSNYGSNIDIMAPGEKILSLDLMGGEGSNEGYPANDNYTFVRGTSFSAPIAAGVVALMLSVNPGLTSAQILKIITDTALKNPPQSGGYDSDCFSIYNAYGLINAGNAVRRAAGLDDIAEIIE